MSILIQRRMVVLLSGAALLAGAVLSAPGWAAISVSDVSVTPKPGAGGTLQIRYRLNQNAESVSINVSNGAVLAGSTTKGVNTVEYAPPGPGLTATITASAPVVSGAGGAVQMMPVTLPDTPAITGVDTFTRPGSPQRDHFIVASGYGASAPAKKAYLYAADGSLLVNKDITGLGGGSYPFGIAVGQGDVKDRVYIGSRSVQSVIVFDPTTGPYDLVTNADYKLKTYYNYMGLDVTPNTLTPNNPSDYNLWMADNKNGRVKHYIIDYAAAVPTITGATPLEVAQSQSTGTPPAVSTADDVQQIAVDPTNRVMFKCQIYDTTLLGASGGTGPIGHTDLTSTSASANLNKWISTDGGANWTMDVTWSAGVIGASGIPEPGRASAYGVALDPDFDANNLAGSTVWVSIGAPAGTDNNPPAIRKVYHVRADTGAIIPEDTIDLDQVEAGGDLALNDKLPRYLSLDRSGNIALTLGQAFQYNATHFTVLAPNNASSTQDTTDPINLEPDLIITPLAPLPAIAGNSGTAKVKFQVEVYDPKGIVEDNVEVKLKLSGIGGDPAQALDAGTPSSDGRSATFSYTYTVPPTAPPGTFDLPVTVSTMGVPAGSAFISVSLYNALVPAWAATLDGAVNSSPATNGGTTYIGTSTGSVYALDEAGQPVLSFAGGRAKVSEPVRGQLVAANGKLYVAGATRVFILNSGTGDLLGTSPSIPAPSVAAVMFDPMDTSLGNRIIAGGSDNKLRLLDGTTGAQLAESEDLGAKINQVAVGPSTGFGPAGLLGQIVVAGTESFTDGANVTGGRIHMLDPRSLQPALVDFSNNPVVYVDAKGAVKSRAAFGLTTVSSGSNFFVIGGASGLWAINADTGEKLDWAADGTYAQNGNPYLTSAPVDANPAVGRMLTTENASVHFATTDGQLFGLTVMSDGNSGAGGRLSHAGDPAFLVPGDGGFLDGAGTLERFGYIAGVTPNKATRMIFTGSSIEDGSFHALRREVDGTDFIASPDRRFVFDSQDTNTFPGQTQGAFNSTPAAAGDNVVIGSSGEGVGRLYGFPTLLQTRAYVKSITPANGQDKVALVPTVTLSFAADVDPTTVTTTTFALYDSAGNAISSSVAQGADAKTYTLTPSNSLSSDQTYIVIVGGVKDVNGAIPPFSSSFFTGTRPRKPNDVNGDGVFNLDDVKDVLRMAGGLIPATDLAMVNGDVAAPSGSLTLEDAVALRHLLP